MSDFSERLTAARERLGWTVEDLAARTKIKADLLHALERRDITRLPGPFYTKAFIRTYAREVGLPGDELVADFIATQPHAAEPAVRVADISPVARLAGYEAPRAGSWQLIPIAAVVVAGVVFFGSRDRTAASRTPEPGAVGTAGVAGAAPDVAGTTGGATAETLALHIKPSGPVWVTASADGRRVLFRLVNAGERAVVEARDEIALRVGDAAAFDYTINGAHGLSLGGPGQVRDITITRANYATFRR